MTSTNPAATPAADPRVGYEAAADQMQVLIASVSPDRFGAPTPCTEWDVRTLLEHIVDGTLRTAALGEQGPGAQMEPRAPQSVPDDGWEEAYADARARFLAAWADDAKLDGVYSVPWGEVPGRGVIGAEIQETVMHAWDLARAVGATERLDERLALAVLPLAQEILPPERRGGVTPFEPVRPAPEGADGYVRLAAWLGREVA